MLLKETLARLRARVETGAHALSRVFTRGRNSTPAKAPNVRILTHSPTEAYIRARASFRAHDGSPVGSPAPAGTPANNDTPTLTLVDIYPEKLTFHDRTTDCRVLEHNGRVVVESLDPQKMADLPAAEPGDKILREDGNVYTLGDDAYMLLDDEGYILNPIGLYRWPIQDRIQHIMEITGVLRRRGIDVGED